jgi:restriction system protein
MARRKSGAAEDLLETASRLPWWAGIVAALVAFIGLRLVAGIEVPVPADSRQIGGMVIRQAIRSVAVIGQWVLPALFLVGAAVSYFKQRRRQALHDEATERGKLAPFAEMSWQDFERVVGEYFRRRGFAVAETGGGGADGGVDIALTRGSDRYLVQCKHWRALRVGVEPVRELYGVIHAQRSAGGLVVTSGTFTDEATRFADGREIELIDGETLAGAIGQQTPRARIEPTLGSFGEAANATPACPICRAPMQLRKAGRGANAGQAFWGCSRFPACRGTRAQAVAGNA